MIFNCIKIGVCYFAHSTFICIIPIFDGSFKELIISLGISKELKLQLMERVRSQINLLFLKTMSSSFVNNSLSSPKPFIMKLCGSTIRPISISESFFLILFFIPEPRSLQALFAFIPIMQSPFSVKSLSFVISIVLACKDCTFG